MEIQMVEALSRPLNIDRDFMPIYEKILAYMNTSAAGDALDKTLYYVCRSYYVKEQPTLKEEAKAYLYYELHRSGVALDYYLANKVPETVRETYLAIREGRYTERQRKTMFNTNEGYLLSSVPLNH